MASTNLPFAGINDESGYPSALTLLFEDYGSGFFPRSLAELTIAKIVGSIREKEEWWIKAQNPEIVAKWRQEAYDQLVGTFLNESTNANEEYIAKMVSYAMDEAQWFAQKYQNETVRPAAVEGVFERHDLANSTLHTQLLTALAALRARPAIGTDHEDRHPGTPQMIDLVHPSMYAYERGKTHILPNVGAEATAMPAWKDFLGKDGVVEPEPAEQNRYNRFDGPSSKAGLQWLPSEFRVSADGEHCAIQSYINSLHPETDAELYSLIGELFCHALPLCEKVLSEAGKHYALRVHNANDVVRQRKIRLLDNDSWWEGSPRDQAEGEDDDAYYEYLDEWEEDSSNRTFRHPEVPNFSPPRYTRTAAEANLRDRPLQVITKFASLELAPGESYGGGVWHVEGTLHERIVCTVCYYLESENIEDVQLAFRTSVEEPDYEQSDYRGVENMYGLADEEALVQDIGSCTTKQGIALAWPNTQQHCVGPVALKDATKPGKRTICCFFLVDPELRIRSTATVPPQQLAWVTETVQPLLASRLAEMALQEKVSAHLESPSLLTYDAACERRERLMDERRASNEDFQESALSRPFSLCEH